jgi:hypothetical protein
VIFFGRKRPRRLPRTHRALSRALSLHRVRLRADVQSRSFTDRDRRGGAVKDHARDPVRYTQRYNRRYSVVGHLFQGAVSLCRAGVVRDQSESVGRTPQSRSVDDQPVACGICGETGQAIRVGVAALAEY